MKNIKENSHIAGFTIIEILVAISIFGILIAVIMSFMLGVFDSNQKSQETLSATTKAQKDLELARVKLVNSYDSPPSDSDLGEDISCSNRDVFGHAISPEACTATTEVPPVRRLTLTRNPDDSGEIILYVDVTK